jgi:transcriptional regulator with XRE-family HTH domain
MMRKADVSPYGCSTVKELAERIGFSRVTVSSFLCGRSRGGRRLREKLLQCARRRFIEAGDRYTETEQTIISKGRKAAHAKK